MGLFLTGCSGASFEQVVGAGSADDAEQSETDDAAGGPGDSGDASDAVTIDGLDSADATGSDTDDGDFDPTAVPTAVFATPGSEGDEEPAPVPSGAYLTAKPGVGAAVPGPSGTVFVLSVYDEPDGDPKTLVYESPDGTTLTYPLTNPTFFGNPLVLRVVDGVRGDEWIRVQAPVHPNGSTVWVRGEDFDFATTDIRIEIDLEDSTLRQFVGDERGLSTRVATGSPDTPTPLGVGYVNEIIADSSPFGPFVINLAMFSEVTSAAPLPAITVHGTVDRDELGEQVTTGTLRAPVPALNTLEAAITTGALVVIYDSSDPETDRDAILAAPLRDAQTTGS